MSTAPLAQPDLSDIRAEGYFTRNLADADPAVFAGVTKELKREQNQIELIASENIVSKAVLEAQGRRTCTTAPSRTSRTCAGASASASASAWSCTTASR